MKNTFSSDDWGYPPPHTHRTGIPRASIYRHNLVVPVSDLRL
jgi:hypothetical protein